MPKTNWKHEIKGFGPIREKYQMGELTFEETRDAFVELFRKQSWYNDESDLFDLVECDLANAEYEQEFDWAVDSIYDWCDDNNVWIAPFD